MVKLTPLVALPQLIVSRYRVLSLASVEAGITAFPRQTSGPIGNEKTLTGHLASIMSCNETIASGCIHNVND